MDADKRLELFWEGSNKSMQPAGPENGTEEKGRTRRAHHRSPSYPMLNLEDSIEKAKLVYAQDKRSATSRAVILKHLGYKDENSGVGNRELSALKQYGLLEEQSGLFRISDKAYSILFLSGGSEEKRASLSEAALSPTVFRDMWAKYGAEASDETLKDYLIHGKNFNPVSVIDVVKNYRATIAFAKPVEVEYNEEYETDSEEESKVNTDHPLSASISAQKPPTLERPIKVPEAEGTISTPVGRDQDRVVFAHVRFEASIRKEYVASLKKYLEYLESTLQ